MSLPYPYITDNPNHLNTASYLNEKESELFIEGHSEDFWYGLSARDAMEFSLFDLDENQIGWTTLNTEKNFRKVDLSYLNTLNQVVSYSYLELLGDFILYKNEKILVNPIEQVSSSFGITSGSYIASYNFIREMAGEPNEPLVIKDISPSRKEIKLIPLSGNNPRFEAFCLKKFQIKDVAPLLIQKTNGCPYDQIYSKVKSDHVPEITYLKNLLFLQTDGEFLGFLRSLYEDVIDRSTAGNQTQETIKRTQGIRSYYQHYLLSNYETISDFFEIDNHFNTFTVARIDMEFVDYGPQNSKEFIAGRQFLIDFFTKYFYHLITLSTQESFDSKYYSFFKNILNLGDNQFFPIIDHAYADERIKESDPLTLLVKLKTELADDIKIQQNCRVTNTSLRPFVVNVIFKTSNLPPTYKISEPNFALESENLSLYNVNTQYTAPDLEESLANQQTIDINKKIGDLYVDYTDFSNFVIFSSAKQRVENFKTKVIQWTSLSSSLDTLNASASQAIAAGTVYPYYASERGIIDGQMTEIIDSFDGYESYLFSSGSYQYSLVSSSFLSSSYVEDQDEAALYYDKTNRDSFINNTPEHIVLDEGNDDYLTFLMMTGHYFDNLYLYITNLPSEKMVDNDPSRTFSKKVIDYTLDSFGWNLGVEYEDTSILDAYTTSSGSVVSAENRTKAIRTRILTTLSQIYKAKGTEESIRLLLSCHGIPSDLLSIREYGGNDFETGSVVTYSEYGKAWLFAMTGSLINNTRPISFIRQSFTSRPATRTVEFKALFNKPDIYPPRKKFELVSAVHNYKTLWGSSDLTGSASYYQTLGYYTGSNKMAWSIGAFREYGTFGRFYAELGSGSLSQQKSQIYLTSSLLPIFDGNISNIMLRRNDPDSRYQYTENIDLVPAEFDLVVQRNEDGRLIWKSQNTMLGDWKDNMIWSGVSSDEIFDQTGSYLTTEESHFTWGVSGSLDAIDFGLGNMMLWDTAISDADFETHCNDFNSFAYSGSDAQTHLITRMDTEEPYDVLTNVNDGADASGSIVNKSEYYLSHSFIWHVDPWMPLNPAFSGSCPPLSTSSLYPYQFCHQSIEKIFTTPRYGPNRFKNKKIKPRSQTVEARLDDQSRSTHDDAQTIPFDSNLLGLYLDPQDAKNKDIIRFLGNQDIVNLIGEPGSQYSASYTKLQAKNEEYNSFGDRRVLYNELISLFKIYFNRSVFDTVKNVLPARASARTGILIEPTVLERPKYQHRKVFSEADTGSVAYYETTASHYFRDPATKLMKFSGSAGTPEYGSAGQLTLLYGEFNTAGVSSMSLDYSTVPSNLTVNMDISYINEANFAYPINYINGYYSDILGGWQLGNFSSLNGGQGFSETIGNFKGNSYDDTSFSVKQWDKYTIYFKSGSQVRNSNKAEDTYVSTSIWLYKIVEMSPDGFNQLFYTSSFLEPSKSVCVLTEDFDIEIINSVTYYRHRANTAKCTPNQSSNLIRATERHIPLGPVSVGAPYYSLSSDTYFEPFGGYPRSHYTHTRMQFSPIRMQSVDGKANALKFQTYIRNRQTDETTIGPNGLSDGTLPVESIETSNVNLVKSDNVINQ